MMVKCSTRRFAAAFILSVCLTVVAGTASADQCTGAKLKAVGKKEAGLLKCQAKIALKGDPTLQADCDAKVIAKFTKGFDKAGTCTGVHADCEGIADDCRDKIRA